VVNKANYPARLYALIGAFTFVLLAEPARGQDTGQAWVKLVKDSLGTTIGDLDSRGLGELHAAKPVDGDDKESAAVAAAAQTRDVSDAADVNPDNPDHRGAIEEWLGIAQPASNAHGARLSYDSWARVYGVTKGGLVVELRGDPSPKLGPSPASHAWATGRKLGSVGHCTLEAFVVTRLQEADIANCSSDSLATAGAAMSSTVSDVRSLSGEAAKEFLQSEGYRVTMREGAIAERPADAGKIATQTPGPGSAIAAGAMIELTTYRTPENVITIPYLIGQPATEAKKTLEALGLAVALQSIGFAPSAEAAFSVLRESPVAGSTARKNDTVTLGIFLEHQALAAVPDVVGMKGAEARKRLVGAGFRVGVSGAGIAPDEARARTIVSIEPAAGTEAAAGSVIRINVYGGADPTFAMPRVVGLDHRAARRRLDQKGLRVVLEALGEAPDIRQALRVTKQSPTEGSRVMRGDTIALSHYGEYVHRIRIPGVLGLNTREAVRTLRELGISAEVKVGGPAPGPHETGTIARQSTPAGDRVRPGARISLTVYDESKQEIEARRREAEKRQAAERSRRQVAEDRARREADDRRRRQEAERRRRAEQERRWVEEDRRREEQFAADQRNQQKRCPDLYRQMINQTKRNNGIGASSAESEAWSIGCSPMEINQIMGPLNQAMGGGWLNEIDANQLLASVGVPVSGMKAGDRGGPIAPPTGTGIDKMDCVVPPDQPIPEYCRFRGDIDLSHIGRYGPSFDCMGLLGGGC